MCEKSRGDAVGTQAIPTTTRFPVVLTECLCSQTNWDEQTLTLLNLAKPHLISGALRGVFLGDELSASGIGQAPHDPEAVSFADIEAWVDLTRGFLDDLAPKRKAAGVKDELILYYTSSDFCATWPRIPHNLTLFSMGKSVLNT